MRACLTCQHLKRPEIDRRLAAGEPLTRIADDHGLTPSSLYRHRANCLGLASANAIKKEAARGSAAVALLPSKESLAEAYQALRNRIDGIVTQAQQEGSLRVALAGLGSVRATLDSLARLAARDAPETTKATAPHHAAIDAAHLAECLIQQFDQDPELKARIAAALIQIDDQGRSTAAEFGQGNAPQQTAEVTASDQLAEAQCRAAACGPILAAAGPELVHDRS